MADRHLIRPSHHVPWDVTVQSVVPPSINKVIEQGMTAYSSSLEGYQAVSAKDDKIFVWKGQNVHALYHPFLKNSDFLSISANSSSAREDDELYVYCLNKSNGYLALWILNSPNERPSLIAKTPSAKIQVSSFENITSMHAMGSSLYLGTGQSDVWRVTVTARPLVLQAEPLTRPSIGMWSYVFGSSGRKSSIQQLLSNDKIYSVTQDGLVEEWTDGTCVGIANLSELLSEKLKVSNVGVNVLKSSCNLGHDLDVIFKASLPQGSRIYWIRLHLQSTIELQQVQWLNRFHDDVECIGLITSENGMAYASFEYDAEQWPVTVVSLSSEPANMVHEVDLPMHEAPSIVGLSKDVETHGAILVTSTGLQIRARWMHLQQSGTRADPSSANQETSFVLANHLRQAFWQYYQTQQIKLSPSWCEATNNSELEYEKAILLTGRQLQEDGDSSSSKNPLEWHLAFIKMIHKTGLYKNVSGPSRWKLLAIGQEISVHNLVLQSNLLNSDDLPPFGLAAKLAKLQEHILNHAPSSEWTLLLGNILKKAKEYREKHHVDSYDVLSDPRNLWTHQLRDVLRKQLEQQPQIMRNACQKEALGQIIQAALEVHQENRSKQYAQVKSLGFQLTRSQLQDDVMALNLCVAHAYYEGLCQLSLDHPRDERFALEPMLLNEDGSDQFQDFGAFALDWFSNHNRYDKVLKYGKLLSDEVFSSILNRDEKLRKFRWIFALRQEKYDVASDFLYENGDGQNIPQTQLSLSLAKLAAKLHHGRSGQKEDDMSDHDEEEVDTRRQRIDYKLDVCKSQVLLMENGNVMPLQSPEHLLKLALEKIDARKEYEDEEDIVTYAMMGLAIAGDNKGHVETVWSKVLEKDLASKWMPWINGTSNVNPTRDVLLENTQFGKLWVRVQDQPVELHSNLQYHGDGEALIQKLGLDSNAGRELKRLFTSVTSIELNDYSSMMIDSQ
eukprot:CAMPEP_0194218084 /NCGR_PEP_ID=MMETSP0156-20130528/22972_1 /TAXON_ID=33649 /ORGANISM="Thalassionema nitzschioides, Strain L26-B" /LENGTH=953 /DNA_ID=CAMNT_0038947319 /DNA_START=6 /DNA_END=2867 /DNA_ORIENTATION=-